MPPKPRSATCVHCGYDLRDIVADGKCPECGNPASDTRQGTLFYRLRPTRMGSIVAGAGLVLAVSAAWLTFTAFEAARWIVPGGITDPALTLWDAIDTVARLVFVPYIGLFMLAVPLNRHATGLSLMRIAAIVGVALTVLLQAALDYHERTAPLAPQQPGTVQVAYAVREVLHIVPMLLICIRLEQIRARLPSRPYASLGSLSIVCATVLVIRAAIDNSGVLYPYPIAYAGVAALTTLMLVPPAAFSFLVFRELRAVVRDIDTDHPYTRV